MFRGKIRVAMAADAEAVSAIYAPIVRDTTISFEVEPPAPDEMVRRIAATLPVYPWLVAEQEGRVIGYAYASRHRDRAAYRWSVDVSAYVDEHVRRCGLGRALYERLISILQRQGFHTAFAGIALPNEPSVGLHEAVGFQPGRDLQGSGLQTGPMAGCGLVAVGAVGG